MPWKNVSGYEIMFQAHDFSCGMACVAMFVHRKGHGKPEESTVRQVSWRVGGGSYKPALKDRAMVQGGGPRMLTATAPPKQTTELGTFMDNMANILNEWQIPAVAQSYIAPLNEIQKARAGQPVIARVVWSGGGGDAHFVLIEKFEPSAPKGLIVCDPIYGLTAMPLSLMYQPASDTTVSGTFSGWVLKGG